MNLAIAGAFVSYGHISSLFLFLKEIFVVRAGVHKMHIRIANREEPDQTAPSEAV